MASTLLNAIDGERSEASDSRWIDVFEPATGRIHARLARSTEEDVARAVSAATAAFGAWSALTADERSRHLLAVADGLESRLEAFAQAESLDTGKPISLARSVDIPRAIHNFRFFATAILHFSSESHATDRRALNFTLRRPRGVAGLISPWNLPLYLLSWKIAPALAAGNTAVAKPSELTPLTASMLADVCRSAGLPPGVLNIVNGLGAEAGAAIVRSREVTTISFTGGTVTGKAIAAVAGPEFKKLSLEMGGKNPNIVFADADLDRAIETGVRSSFLNQGQICLCGSRILVERPVYDRFVTGLVERARALRIGDPSDEATQFGALVSREHLAKVESYVQLARDEGGRVLCGGDRPEGLPERCREGWFLSPTVVTDLGPDCRVNQEEIFGPVVTVQPFTGEEEAIALADATPYGLSASLWTESLPRAHRVADRLQAGTVWVNCWMLRDLRVPFGGMKQSGVGREGGVEALRFFTEPKNVCIRYPGEPQ